MGTRTVCCFRASDLGEEEHPVHRCQVESMLVDGTVSPLRVTLESIDEVFPANNANLVTVIDEASRRTERGCMCLVVAGCGLCSEVGSGGVSLRVPSS